MISEQTRRRRCPVSAVVAALLASPALALADPGGEAAHWAVVPDEYLGSLRGGLDLGLLTGYFAIERVVRVDGIDVARTLLVIEDVGRITRGALPAVHVLGNLANLIQIGPANTAPGVSAAQQATAAAQAATAAALQRADAATLNAQSIAAAAQQAALRAGQIAMPAGSGSGTVSSAGIGNSAVNSSANIGSSSMAQFGSGLDQAIGVATGEIAAPPAPAPVATRAPSTAAAAAPAVASTPSLMAPAPASVPAAAAPPAPTAMATIPATMTLLIPVGNSGQVIVVSNIPNAAPLAMAIQNSVAATQIEAQTKISASLENSLSALRSGALAAAIRQQAIQSTR